MGMKNPQRLCLWGHLRCLKGGKKVLSGFLAGYQQKTVQLVMEHAFAPYTSRIINLKRFLKFPA